MFIEHNSEMLGKWLTGGTYIILISNTAGLCAATLLGCDF